MVRSVAKMHEILKSDLKKIKKKIDWITQSTIDVIVAISPKCHV